MTEPIATPNPPFLPEDMERAIPTRWTVTLILTALLLGLSVYPGTWLSQQPPFAQLFAFRGLWIVVALTGVVLSLIVFSFRWHHQLPRRVATIFLIITTLASFGQLSIGWGYGLRNHALAAVATPEKGFLGTDITVLSLNMYADSVTPKEVVSLVQRLGADIIVLNETRPTTVAAIAFLLGQARNPMQVFHSPTTPTTINPAIHHTALLVSVYFGTYLPNPALTPHTAMGSIAVSPSPLDANATRLPHLVAAHAMPPVLGHTGTWRDDVRRISTICREDTGYNVILAGDLNATPWHGMLADAGECTDALAHTDSGSIGTWPQFLPPVLGVPIDHIFVSSRQWLPEASTVVTVPGSDHRAVATKLRTRPVID